MRKLFVITMLVALCATGASAGVWNAVDDFSIAAQPANGVWTYGYGVGPVVDDAIGWTGLGGFFDFSFGASDSDGGWTRDQGGAPDYSPYLYCNKTATAGTYPAHSLNLGSGVGGGDYMTFVRWTAPEDGVYQVDGVFKMMQFADMSFWQGEMDVYVAINGALVFSDMVSGSDYSQYSGAWPGYDPGPKSFTGFYTLAAGDTVDFVGGIGMVNANSDFVNIDGCQVSTVPEPSSILALLGGLAGVAGYIRRRK